MLNIQEEAAMSRQKALAGILEMLGEDIELPQSRYEDAKNKYEAVGEWLKMATDERLSSARIYPQGSIRLGTAIKPLKGDEFDVDSVVSIDGVADAWPPEQLKALLGDRLRENLTYSQMLEEKTRCWRLNYADSSHFHMDILPATCDSGGQIIQVPDKALHGWKPSNPEGYADWFLGVAKKSPQVKFVEKAMARVEPLPDQIPISDALRRTVQICKRHRDHFYAGKDPDLKPISVILTTLFGRAQEELFAQDYVGQFDYVSKLIEHCLDYVEIRDSAGQRDYWVVNPACPEENFAEKWNECSERRVAFYQWHSEMTRFIKEFSEARGAGVYKSMSVAFGEAVALNVQERSTRAYSEARKVGNLGVTASGLGLVPSAVTRKNTFYGK